MKHSNTFLLSTVIRYDNIIFRVVLTFAMAVFFTLYGEGIRFLDALLYPSFYLAVCGSTIIAFILINYVHLVTVRLDKIMKWSTDGMARMLLQVLFGFAAPCIIAYYLALFYFLSFGVNIQDRDYIQQDYPLVVIFLFALNCYYYFRYEVLYLQALNRALHFVSHSEDRSHTEDNKELVIDFNNHKVKLHIFNDIAFFYSAVGNWIKTKDGRSLYYDTTLKDIETRFCKRDFVRINRGCVINCNIVSHYLSGKRRDTYLVYLKKPFVQLEMEGEDWLLVTEKYAKSFVKRMQELDISKR